MVNFIEEAFQVNIYNVLITAVDVVLCFEYCLLGIFVRTETITVILKIYLEQIGQHLPYGLLEHPLDHGRHAQQTNLSVAFGYLFTK